MRQVVRALSAQGLESEGAAYEYLFFDRVVSANGVTKSTCEHRLDELNEAAEPYVRMYTRPIAILDAAVSSGVTTIEWSTSLTLRGIAHHITASDACIRGVLCSYGRWLDILIDPRDGHALFVDIFGGRISALNRLTQRRRIIQCFSRLARGRMGSRSDVLLVTSALLEAPSISVVEDDIFEWRPEWDARFDVIRAANILNLSYFSSEDLIRALGNLRRRLRPGGLLIVGRTHADGLNHASFFKFCDPEFALVDRVGEGSEVEQFVLNLQVSSR